ncbi:MAG: hypothetical protein C0602_11320 [Denitrovibrio sp.]|nr:MAG: hypothetical protein C0602_11320 [Denitrovibrio sp.]
MSSMRLLSFLTLLLIGLLTFGCGGGSSSSNVVSDNTVDTPETDDTAETVDTSVYYPENLTVSSPLKAQSAPVAERAIPLTSFSSQLSTIISMLSGSTIASCAFDPELFLQEPGRAPCYGPAMLYQNHPDGSGGDGELPGGDLGIWLETNAGSSEACSASQMNSRMEGIGNKSYAAFTALASMICVNLVNGHGIPSETTNDIVTDMNDMAAAASLDATFTTATITHQTVSSQNEFTYTLDYSYTAADATVYPMYMKVTHRSDSGGDYTGKFQYSFDMDTDAGNCPVVSGVIPQTVAGSVLYARTGTDFAIDARYANFCGNGATGFVSGLVDPSDKYNASTNPDGWGDNFNRFVAGFEESTFLGDYTYSWQAGLGDNNTRVLNIAVTQDSGGTYAGESWFGYGADAASSDNSIGGFICNWAGPGNSHAYADKVQYQSLLQDAATLIFEPVTNNLLYAPAVSCNDEGSFVYDSDADSDLADENAADLLTNNLRDLSDYESAFTAPTPPSNF